MDIWCCCQQCWPETPVVTWGHIARQQGTVHSTLATVHQWTHGPLRYQSSPCKKWHCLDLFKVQDVLPSGYIAHMSQPPAPVSSHCWLLLNLTNDQDVILCFWLLYGVQLSVITLLLRADSCHLFRDIFHEERRDWAWWRNLRTFVHSGGNSW